MLHIATIVQLRRDTDGRAYFERKRGEGKTSMEAMRRVKRHLSDVVYRQQVTDAEHATKPGSAETNSDGAGPGGHPGTTTNSSVAGLTPETGTSDQPQPEPAPATLAPPRPTRQTPGSGTSRPGAAQRRRRQRGAPTGGTTLTPPSTTASSTASRRRY